MDFKTLHQCGVPEHMHGAVTRYIEDGISGGSFLTCVFAGDVREAFARADHVNIGSLDKFDLWIRTCAPPGSWGSYEAVDSWAEKGGLKGHNKGEDNG